MNNKTIDGYDIQHYPNQQQQILEKPTSEIHRKDILLLTICTIAVVENILVCLLIYHSRSLRTTTNVFTFGLCLTNILFAGVLLPIHCFNKTSEVYLYLTIIIILIYICNLTAVTFERFIAIVKPFHYVTIITKTRAVYIIISCYLVPSIYCLLPMAWKAEQGSTAHKVYITFTLVVFLLLPLVFIVLVYAKVYHETHKFFQKHRKLVSNSHEYADDEESPSNFWQEVKFICCLCRHDIQTENSDIHEMSSISSCDFVVAHFPSNEATNQSDENPIFDSDKKDMLVQTNNSNITIQIIKSNDNINNDIKNNNLLDVNNFKPRNNSIDEVRSKNVKTCQHTVTKPKHKRDGELAIKNNSLKTLRPHKMASKRLHKKAKQKLTELKATMAFGIVSLAYMFTWLPVVYMNFLNVTDQLHKLPSWLSVASVYTIAFNATIDPLLYGLLLRSFRRAIIRKFRNLSQM